MLLSDPCNKCIVRPMCSKRCDAYTEWRRSYLYIFKTDKQMWLPVGLGIAQIINIVVYLWRR